MLPIMKKAGPSAILPQRHSCPDVQERQGRIGTLTSCALSRLTNRSRRRMLGTTPLDTREMALAVATRRRCMRRTRRRRARGIVSILFASDGRVGSNAAFLAQALERAPTPTPSLSVSTLCRRRRDHMPSVCTLEPPLPLPGPYQQQRPKRTGCPSQTSSPSTIHMDL